MILLGKWRGEAAASPCRAAQEAGLAEPRSCSERAGPVSAAKR